MKGGEQEECAVCRYPLEAAQVRCPECGSFYRRVPVRAPEWVGVLGRFDEVLEVIWKPPPAE